MRPYSIDGAMAEALNHLNLISCHVGYETYLSVKTSELNHVVPCAWTTPRRQRDRKA